MLKWLSLKDEDLPTWLHTALWFALVSFFALPLGWEGISAIATRRLEPSMDDWFSPHALEGSPAVADGFLRIELMLTFYAFALVYSRWGEGRKYVRVLPWVLFAIYAVAGFFIARTASR